MHGGVMRGALACVAGYEIYTRLGAESFHLYLTQQQEGWSREVWAMPSRVRAGEGQMLAGGLKGRS